MKSLIQYVFFGILFFLVGIDFFIPKGESLFIGQTATGFMAFYGFISCVSIIVVSKMIGYLWISKKEDYYDE